MKEFIYFFKHKNIEAIKIGRTSGTSVNDRFNCFKTYSPFGSEIIGFFECDNCVLIEKKIHTDLKSNRMSGEWFDISIPHALSIINEYDTSLKSVKSAFNEWISNPENNHGELLKLMIVSNSKIKGDDYNSESKEYLLVNKYIDSGTDFLTATSILKYISMKEPGDYSINKIGSSLKKIGIERSTKSNKYGYLIKFK